MKYSLLLATLLSVSTLFGVETVQHIDSQLDGATTIGDYTETPVTLEPVDVEEKFVEKNEPKPVGSVTDTESNNKISKDKKDKEPVLERDKTMLISVTGQGVAPMNTTSPAQAYALAKRAAVADAYRLIAEKVKGVRIDGQDLIKNMMVKRSTIRTSVQAMVKNASIAETTFKEGLCEVEMEITLSYSDF